MNTRSHQCPIGLYRPVCWSVQPLHVRFQGLFNGGQTLELAFHTKALRTICENEERARAILGPSAAEILKHRLADLRAATSVKDLLAGQPRLLDGTDNQQMVLDLCEGRQLVFCANHLNNPADKDGKLDWPSISRIKILRIGGDHVEQP